MKRNILLVLLVMFLSLPSIWSLFHPGFFQSDDGEWMIIRFSAFHQAFREGQFPVRFLERLNYGYGYPVANFLYPGFMYLAEPIHILGVSFVNTIKVVLGLSMIGSAVFCFFWLKRLFKTIPAIVGSLFYLYTPYHLYDLYKRGSVGEILALAVVPFILWQLERKSYFWTSLGIAFLLLSHNTLAVIFVPVILAYILVKDKKGISKQSVLFILAVFLTGFGFAAFFWLPALFELSYTKFSQTNIANIKEYYAQVPLVGISSLVLLGLAMSSLALQRLDPTKNRLFAFFFSLTILSIFFATEYSEAIWEMLPSSFVQFPYRVLSYLILSASFLAAFCISSYKGSKQMPILLILGVCLVYSALPFIQPAVFHDKGESFYATNEGTTTVKNEYMPVWVRQEPVTHYGDKVQILASPQKPERILSDSNRLTIFASGSSDQTVRVQTIYYPGWEAKVDGVKRPISYTNEYGVIDIPVKKGETKIELYFRETPLRIIADSISLVSLAVLLIFGITGVIRLQKKTKK